MILEEKGRGQVTVLSLAWEYDTLEVPAFTAAVILPRKSLNDSGLVVEISSSALLAVAKSATVSRNRFCACSKYSVLWMTVSLPAAPCGNG